MKSVREMKEIGAWIDLAKYYEDKEGIVWCWHASNGQLTNCGPIDKFRERFDTLYRGKLYPVEK